MLMIFREPGGVSSACFGLLAICFVFRVRKQGLDGPQKGLTRTRTNRITFNFKAPQVHQKRRRTKADVSHAMDYSQM